MKEQGRSGKSPNQEPTSRGNVNQKEQGGVHKDSAANNPLLFPVEPKKSNKLSFEPIGEKNIEKVSKYNSGRTVFDCAVPEVIPSPFHIRRMLRDEIVTEEQAQKLERQWLGELKTMDRRSLEGETRWWETIRDRFSEEQKQEEVQEIEQQLEIIQEQSRQRGED
jgi:hypothetical protein